VDHKCAANMLRTHTSVQSASDFPALMYVAASIELNCFTVFFFFFFFCGWPDCYLERRPLHFGFRAYWSITSDFGRVSVAVPFCTAVKSNFWLSGEMEVSKRAHRSRMRREDFKIPCRGSSRMSRERAEIVSTGWMECSYTRVLRVHPARGRRHTRPCFGSYDACGTTRDWPSERAKFKKFTVCARELTWQLLWRTARTLRDLRIL